MSNIVTWICNLSSFGVIILITLSVVIVMMGILFSGFQNYSSPDGYTITDTPGSGGDRDLAKFILVFTALFDLIYYSSLSFVVFRIPYTIAYFATRNRYYNGRHIAYILMIFSLYALRQSYLMYGMMHGMYIVRVAPLWFVFFFVCVTVISANFMEIQKLLFRPKIRRRTLSDNGMDQHMLDDHNDDELFDVASAERAMRRVTPPPASDSYTPPSEQPAHPVQMIDDQETAPPS